MKMQIEIELDDETLAKGGVDEEFVRKYLPEMLLGSFFDASAGDAPRLPSKEMMVISSAVR